MEWTNLPFAHEGRWIKKYPSIMNPLDKVTWPQLVAEFVIFWRKQFLPNYKGLGGPGWSSSIQRHVRNLNQQACVLCNYFPHPSDDPLVEVAFKSYFRKNRPMKIGQYRKVRFTIKNGREVSNITQDEKDVVLGIDAEYQKLVKQRNMFSEMGKTEVYEEGKIIKFGATKRVSKLNKILELEKKLKEKNGG